MHHVYGMAGKAFYVLDIYYELVEKDVEFLLQNSTIYYKKYVQLQGASPLIPDPLGAKPPRPHYKLVAVRADRLDFTP